MSWHDRKEVKLGDYGEDIIIKYLEDERRGWIIYKTETNKSHPIDYIGFNKDDDMFFFEVKTKPRRFCCEDTGINLHSFERYKKLIEKSNREVYIYFIDEFEECVYYIKLNDVIENNRFYIEHDPDICYFYLKDMKLISILSKHRIEEMRRIRFENNLPFNLSQYKHTQHYFENIIKEKIKNHEYYYKYN